MKVPFFDYPRHYLDQKEEILKIIDEVCSRGAFILQKDLANFETSLSKYVNCNYAVGVANATDGLEICWQSYGLQSGDEVIVSSHTMLATASSVKMAGGVPVPIDIGKDNLIDVSNETFIVFKFLLFIPIIVGFKINALFNSSSL